MTRPIDNLTVLLASQPYAHYQTTGKHNEHVDHYPI